MSLLDWLDASGFREAAFGSICLAIVAFLAIAQAVLPEARLSPAIRSRWTFAVFVVLAIFAARWPSILYHLDLNRDESQMTAQAITILHHPIPWKSYDGTTSGPLNSAVLVIPAFVGAPIDFVTARLVAIGLFCGTLAFLFAATRTLYGELAARVGILMPLAFFCFVRRPDFTHYSSELLPMFLLSAAAYGLVRLGTTTRGSRTALLTGIVLGCLPFAKLQSVLLGACLLLVAAAIVAWSPGMSRRQRLQCGLALVAGTLLVPIAIVGVVAIAGAFHDFYVSYVEFPPVYLQSNCCRTAGPSFFLGETFFRAFLGTSISFIALCVAGIVLLGHREARRPKRWLPPALALALVPVSIYSIEVPQTPFEHYLILLLWPLAFATAFAFGALLAELRNARRVGAALAYVALAAAILTCGPFVRLNFVTDNYYLGRLRQNLQHAPDQVTAMLLRHVKPGDRMAIWGWMPRYFVETGALLGTRDSLSQFQIETRVFQSYYRERYLADMLANRPEFFLDAVAPGSFRYKDRATQGHETFPALSALLDRDYKLVDEVAGVRLYQRTAG